MLGFYFFRNPLLEQVINKTKNKAATDYDCTFSIKKVQFDGLTSVVLDELVRAPNNADTLFNIKKFKTSVNFWRLLLGDAQLGTLEVNTGYVQLVQKGKLKNFATFIKKDSTETQTTEKRDYAAFAYRIISKVFNLVPTDMDVQNLVFKLDDNGRKAEIGIQKLVLLNKELETSIQVRTNTFAQR